GAGRWVPQRGGFITYDQDSSTMSITYQRGAGQVPPALFATKREQALLAELRKVLAEKMAEIASHNETKAALAETRETIVHQQGELSRANQAMRAGLGMAQQMTSASHHPRDELQRVKQAHLWEEHLFANPELEPADKLYLWAAAPLVREGKVRDSKGRVRV